MVTGFCHHVWEVEWMWTSNAFFFKHSRVFFQRDWAFNLCANRILGPTTLSIWKEKKTISGVGKLCLTARVSTVNRVLFAFLLPYFFFCIILFYFMHRHVQKQHQTKLQAEPLLKGLFLFCFLHFAHNDAHPTSPLHVRYDFGMMASWFMNLFSFIVCTHGGDPPSATPFT